MPAMRIYTAAEKPEPVPAAFEKSVAAPEDFRSSKVMPIFIITWRTIAS